MEKKLVKQYAIEIIFDENEKVDEEQMAMALENAGYSVSAVAWKATWNEDDYWDGKPPVSYN